MFSLCQASWSLIIAYHAVQPETEEITQLRLTKYQSADVTEIDAARLYGKKAGTSQLQVLLCWCLGPAPTMHFSSLPASLCQSEWHGWTWSCDWVCEWVLTPCVSGPPCVWRCGRSYEWLGEHELHLSCRGRGGRAHRAPSWGWRDKYVVNYIQNFQYCSGLSQQLFFLKTLLVNRTLLNFL